jgi:hypothetical protein
MVNTTYALINHDLADIDPFDPNLTDNQILAILEEAKVNPPYFYDKCLKRSPVLEVSEEETPVALTEFQFHEVTHTASVIEDMFDRHILDHRAVFQTPELHQAAEKVSQALHDFYQLAAEVSNKE